MSTLQPLYRFTLYAPFNEDATESTVLTPIGGAAHSDPFVVTTMQGVTGAKPYLAMPSGRAGSLDYTTKKTTTGNLTLSIFDPRVTAGGSNSTRWSTAFLGDSLGRTRLKSCRWTLERSLDGTVGSLVPFAAGRVRNQSVKRAQWLDLDTVDFADDLNRPLFTGAPHSSITYASPALLLPHGIKQAYSHLPVTPPVAATLSTGSSTPGTLLVNITTSNVPAVMITQAVMDSNIQSVALRLVRLVKVSDSSVHYYQWPRGDHALASTAITGGPTPHFGLTAFPIAPLPAGDYRTEALLPAGTAVTVQIIMDAPPTKATPILVDDVHPVQYLADLIDGKFSAQTGSTATHPLATRNTGGTWATLLADPSFGFMREVVEQAEPKANDYIEKVILQRYNLALVRDASGHLDVVDLRRTASLAGAVTLTDADLVTDVDPAWDDSRSGAVTGVEIEYYLDQQAPVTDLVASSDTFPKLPSSLITSTKSSVLVLNDLSTLKDVGQKIVTIAARGDRVSSGPSSADWATVHAGRDRQHYIEAQLTAAANDFLRPLGSGTITAKATYRLASANVASIAVGKYCIVQHTKLPDPASNTRGGARLMLCLARNDTNDRTAVTWLDAGIGSVAVAPTITSVTSADVYSVDVTVAANGAGDPMDIHVAVTATSVGTHPADNAAEWLFATKTGAGTVHIANLPPGQRIWVRARSYGNAPNTKLPSAWVYAASIDLASGTAIDLTPPSANWTPLDSLASSSLSDLRQTDGSTTSTITWVRGPDVAEVWGASAVVAVPLDVSNWTPVVAALAPLGTGVNQIVVTKPADGQATLVQLVPYRADGTPGTVVRRVLYGLPQVPTWQYDDKEVNGVGTQWLKLTERGIAVTSVHAQSQVASGAFTSMGAPTRGPGATSVVKGGVLGANEYEQDVPLSTIKGRQSFIRFQWALANGATVTSPDFAFDADRQPNIVSIVNPGGKFTVTGDSDTKSVLLGSMTRAWQKYVDGQFLTADVTVADDNGNAGLIANGTDTFLVRVFNEPVAEVGAGYGNIPGPATADYQDQQVTFYNGTGTGGTGGSPLATWVTVTAAAPSLGHNLMQLSLKASAAPSGWTVKVFLCDPDTSPAADVTSSLSPALSAPPTTLTNYTKATEMRTGSGGDSTLITITGWAQLLNGSGVVQDSKSFSVSYYA